MFDKLKDMGSMMKQAKEMRSKMKVVQSKLKKLKVSAVDKMGWIKVILTGDLDCTGVQILNMDEIVTLIKESPEKAKAKLEQAIMQAFNKAAGESKKIATSNLSEVSGGMNIPGLS